MGGDCQQKLHLTTSGGQQPAASGMCVLSHFSRVGLCVTLWTIALQAPLSAGFSRQEYRSGLPFPPPGDLLNLVIKPVSPVLAGGFFTMEPSGKPLILRMDGENSNKELPMSLTSLV